MKGVVTEFLTADHDRLDVLLDEMRRQLALARDRAEALYSVFRRGLEQHIAWEETLLFPLFESRTGLGARGPTGTMRTEHARVRMLLDEIDQAIVDGRAMDALVTDLAEMLEIHHMREENTLYPVIDDILESGEAAGLFLAMAG